jgi:OPA family glycerol-3-phosphate transporter-like MFS transporter 3
MGHWFSKENRGKVIGTWSANQCYGNISGSLGAGLLLYLGVPWPLVLLPPACVLCIVAILFFFVAEERPTLELLQGEFTSLNAAASPLINATDQKRAISFWEAWRLPGVAIYAIDFAFVKLLNYGMMFWLPYYLSNIGIKGIFRGTIAATYDVGAIFGSAATGFLSDKVGSRVLVLFPMLLIGIPLFFCFRLVTTDTYWLYYILVPATGWAVAGSANMLSSAVAADLAKKQELGVPVESTATIAGIIDGTGSLGAGLGQLLIGYIQTESWDVVFALLMGMFQTGVGGCAVLLLLPYFIRDACRVRYCLRVQSISN